jgi:hypothetical protein
VWAPKLSGYFEKEEDFGIGRESKFESPNLLPSGPHHVQVVG